MESRPGGKGGLLERDVEQSALAELIHATRARRGGGVLLEGPPGIGRSSLVSWTAGQAERVELSVAAVTASPVSRQIPFGIVRRLLTPFVADRPELLRSGWARRARPLFGADLPGAPTIEPLVEGLLALVTEIMASADRSLLLLIDDAHWIDPGSSVFLTELVLRAGEVGAGLVAAINLAELSEVEPGPERLRAVPGLRRLRLEPLSGDAVRALVAARGSNGAAAGPADEIHAAAAGNPLLTTAFLADLAGPADPGAIPATIAAWAAERVNRLPDRDRALLQAVAILQEGPLRIAGRLAGLDDHTTDDAADRLAARGILCPGEPIRFAQPVIGRALLAEMPGFAQARLHRRAGELLLADGSPQARAAIHLEHSRPAGDPAVASVLHWVGKSFLRRGDPARAAEMLTRALAEPPADDELDELLVERAQAEAAAGRPSAIGSFRQALDRIADPRARIAAWHGLSRLLYARGDGRGAVAAAREGRRETSLGDLAEEQLLGDELTAASLVPELAAESVARAARLLDGPAPRDPGLLAHLIVHQGWHGLAVDRLPELARAAVARDPLVDPASGGFALSFVAGALNFIDATPLAIELLDRGLESVIARGDPLAEVSLRACRAWAAYFTGDLAGAETHIAAAEALTGGLNWPAVTGLVGQVTVMVSLERGDRWRARRVLQATPATPQNPGLDFFRGALAAAEDDPDRAQAHFEAAGAELEGVYAMNNPGVLPWRSAAAQAAVAGGHPERARELLAPELERARELGIPRSLGIALRVAGLIDDDLTALGESVAVLEGSPARLELARSLVALGAGLRSDRRLREARETLVRALELIDELGAAALGAQARGELRAAGARRRRRPQRGVAALSPSERRVAELAAEGRTTRQIAAALYLTPKTVEGHLTRVYRKLRISSRREIAALLHDLDAGVNVEPGSNIRPDDHPATSPSP
jgi:DNA-binding CsgD family transcriptional regulator